LLLLRIFDWTPNNNHINNNKSSAAVIISIKKLL
jgi:hypothetical protein